MSAPAAGAGSRYADERAIKRCSACGRSYARDDWQALASVDVLPPERIQPYISVSADWAIDVRRCACGATLAARRRVVAPAAPRG
ncbi:MAG TPA: hypothetical protein VE987_22515 [Polyangiaceae bacterium]|nr:hypothetical protein [Polyangiaceae bacterium]